MKGDFDDMIKAYTVYLGLNAVLWFTVYTGVLASIPLFQAMISNIGLTYYQFWNSIVILSAVGGFFWVIVKS